MDRLEEGIRYKIPARENVYVGRLPNQKRIALYVEHDAKATVLAWFTDESKAALFLESIGEIK
jgi:hypothetical protein